MFVFLNIHLATQSSIYLWEAISLQTLADAAKAGIQGGAKSKVARVGIYDRGAPASLEYGEQAQAGDGHIHTRNVLQVLARGLVREVSSLSLCYTGLGSTPSPLRRHPRPGPRR